MTPLEPNPARARSGCASEPEAIGVEAGHDTHNDTDGTHQLWVAGEIAEDTANDDPTTAPITTKMINGHLNFISLLPWMPCRTILPC